MNELTESQQIIANAMSEAELQANVDDALRKAGAQYVYHTHKSRYSERSMPDTFAVLDGRLIFIENKREKGKFIPAGETPRTHRYQPGQLDIMEIILATGKAEVYSMRPSEWLAGKMELIISGLFPNLQADIAELRGK